MDWPTMSLQEAIDTLIDYRGKTPKKSSSGIRLITAKVIKKGRILSEPAEFISEDEYKQWMRRGFPKQWDVLLTTEAPLGELGILRTSETIALAQRVILLRANPALLEQKFLFYVMQGDFVQHQLSARASGATVLGIKQSELRQVEVPVPPLPVQRRIASVLSAYDDLIENNTRRIEILEEMARRLYEEWFVHFRFPGHEKVSFKETELGRIPEGWSFVPLSEASSNFDRYRKPLSKKQRSERQGPYPYYGAAKVFDFIDDYIFDGRYLLMAEDGSVITKDGFPVLQLAAGKFWANNHTHILQGRERFSTEFLYLALSDYPIGGHITGAAQPKITQANMNRIPILKGPESIHACFDDKVIPLFRLKEKLESKNANLRAQRDLLLPKLVSGEIDVSHIPVPDEKDAQAA